MSTTQQTVPVVQGLARDFTFQTPNNDGSYGVGYVGTDPITSVIWAGDNQASLSTPQVIWGSTTVSAAAGAAVTLWTIQFRQIDTGGLLPGIYRLQVLASHNGITSCLFDGLVEVISTAGTNAAPPDLITITYAEDLLTRTLLSEQEREVLPQIISAAGAAIRKWCGSRDFTRQVYTEEYVIAQDGRIALKQMPVNFVSRIQSYLQTALTVTASSAVFQVAYAQFVYTGDWASGTLTSTGIQTTSIANGVTVNTTFPFATYPLVQNLQAAIAALPGWAAYTSGAVGLWPSTLLVTGDCAKGRWRTAVRSSSYIQRTSHKAASTTIRACAGSAATTEPAPGPTLGTGLGIV